MADVKDSTKPRSGSRSWVDAIAAVGLGLAATVAVALTIDDVGLTYDEPVYFHSHALMRNWLRHVVDPDDGITVGDAVRPDFLEPMWRYEVPENRHPPMTGYLANLSWLLFRRWLHAAWAYRMSSAILFGLLVGLLFREARRAWGRSAGLGAALALVLMPRIFGHAHVAATDTPSMVMWFLCYVAFRKCASDRGGSGNPGRHRRWTTVGWIILFGITLGISFITKFTNWLVVVPLVVWAARFRKRVPWTWVWLSLPVALAVAIGLNPKWWGNVLGWSYRFAEVSLTRGQSFAIPTYFLGRTYRFSLPWYNGPLLTVATTPLITVLLFLIGAVCVCRDRLRTDLGMFGVATILFLWIARALPSAPGHDGIRLFAAAFPFVAALAGRGLAAIAQATRKPRAAGLALLAVLALSAGYQLVAIHPYHLAYYSDAVGGLRGARRLGFETTYWWDAATDEFLDLLNDEGTMPPNARVFVIPGWPTLAYWQERGRVRSDIHFVTFDEVEGDVDFVMFLCRQGKFAPRFSGVPWPLACSERAMWGWYHRADQQWRAFAPREGVPLVVIVRLADSEAILD